jgi:hypothetical protein
MKKPSKVILKIIEYLPTNFRVTFSFNPKISTFGINYFTDGTFFNKYLLF